MYARSGFWYQVYSPSTEETHFFGAEHKLRTSTVDEIPQIKTKVRGVFVKTAAILHYLVTRLP